VVRLAAQQPVRLFLSVHQAEKRGQLTASKASFHEKPAPDPIRGGDPVFPGRRYDRRKRLLPERARPAIFTVRS
jgi:hypothetical protein